MPRLLSNKSPRKTSPELKVEKKSESFTLTPKAEQKFIKPTVQKSFKPKSEDEMTAWEYYSFLMRFGKRKMTRIEWVIWKMKKDEEDIQKGYVKGKMSSMEYHWRLKKDPHFVDFIAREEFSLDFNK